MSVHVSSVCICWSSLFLSVYFSDNVYLRAGKPSLLLSLSLSPSVLFPQTKGIGLVSTFSKQISKSAVFSPYDITCYS